MSAASGKRLTVSGPAGRRPMVFVHGIGSDQQSWRFVAPAFEPDYRIVLFDHLGAEFSDVSEFDADRYGSLHGFADDLLDVCDDLDLSDAVLVGHSAGAMVGMLAAIADPGRFSALVALGPSPRYIDDEGYTGGFSLAAVEQVLEAMDRNYYSWCSTYPPVFMGNPERPELADELSASFRRLDPDVSWHVARTVLLSDHRDDLPRVPTPTLVVQATEEPVAPEEVGRFVNDRLPDSELVLLRAAGHFPHISAPAETVAAIHGFLERRFPAEGGDRGRRTHAASSAPAPDSSPEAGQPASSGQAPFGYVVTGMDWRIRAVNRSLLDWLGRQEHDLIGRPFTDLLTESGRNYHTLYHAPQVRTQGVLREVSVELARVDGSALPTLLSSVAVEPDAAAPPTIHSTFLDARQRERYSSELSANRRQWARQLRMTQQAVAGLAGAARVADVAGVVAKSVAASFDAADGSLWVLDAAHTGVVQVGVVDQPPPHIALDEQRAEVEALRTGEVVVDPDRGLVAAAAWCRDHVVGVIVLEVSDVDAFDLEARRRLRAVARQVGLAVDRAQVYEHKDRLLSVVSHELRTPLTPILGFAELVLARHSDLPAELQQALEVIKRNAEHLIAVVDDLLSVTRSRQGIAPPSPQPVDLAAFVRRSVSDLDDPGIEVVARTERPLAWVDPDHLGRIVGNLLSNALRYGKPPVRVTVDDDGSHAELVVEDRGSGVPAPFVPRLFDEFTQAQTGDRRSTSGLGLGLAIVRDLVSANHGHLAYESADSHGARFVVRLPSGAVDSAVAD